MQSFSVLWSKALNIIESKMDDTKNKLGFNLWIKELKPEFIDSDYCYFETATDVHKTMLDQKFKNIIESSLNEAANIINPNSSFNCNAIFLTHEEMEKCKLENTEKELKPKNADLNPNYTFDSFVKGSSNELAYTAARAVSQLPGKTLNPLFIYGGVGLGKTHLMHAIGNEISNLYPDYDIKYVTSEAFTNEFIDLLMTKKTLSAFRNKYRKVDVLLIDDIQFISNKTGTQEEFFHTFNALYEAEKLIVISSDKLPEEIPGLEERLVSRFKSGLSVDIGMPDYETRVAILKTKAPTILSATNSNMTVADEVFEFIASKTVTNIRDLEGALKRVIAYAPLILINEPYAEINLKVAEIALKNFFSEPTIKIITPNLIIKTVCEYFNITEEDMLSKKKNREITVPRQIAMYIMRTITDLTYSKIGEFLGKRDHSTVMYAADTIKNMINEDKELNKTINDIIHKIKD